MQNRWVLRTITGLAFVRKLMEYCGFGMDKGIVLVAQDDESAALVKQLFVDHFEAVDIRTFDKTTLQVPLNYQIGIHLYRSSDKKEKVLLFLDENAFLPVLIVGGIVPDMVLGKAYIFSCSPLEADFIEEKERYRIFVEKLKGNIAGTISRVKGVAEMRNCDKGRVDERYTRLYKNIYVIGRLWRSINECCGMEEETAEMECMKYLKTAVSEIETMEEHEAGCDVYLGVRNCIMDWVANKNTGFSEVNEGNLKGILYDEEYYYIPEKLAKVIWSPLLKSVSFQQLKREMLESGILECNSNKNTNYTVKKLVQVRSRGFVRMRFLRIRKECFLTDSGLPLEENIY